MHVRSLAKTSSISSLVICSTRFQRTPHGKKALAFLNSERAATHNWLVIRGPTRHLLFIWDQIQIGKEHHHDF
jgi:hypothetical protein